MALSGRKVIHPGKKEENGLLVGLCNQCEFVLSLGIVVHVEEGAISVATPFVSLDDVAIPKFGRF